MMTGQEQNVASAADDDREDCDTSTDQDTLPKEVGGRDGPEPTRYGDWEKNGRCIDF